MNVTFLLTIFQIESALKKQDFVSLKITFTVHK
jgi:hypothetical protein